MFSNAINADINSKFPKNIRSFQMIINFSQNINKAMAMNFIKRS